MSLFFTRRKTDRPQNPERHSNREGVSVTASDRRRPVIDHPAATLDPDLTGCDVEHVRAHLPNAGSPGAELRACRVAAVLDREAKFLADRTGTVEPPERFEVVDACAFAAEFIRDRIVVGAKA